MERLKCPWPGCDKLFDTERGLSQHRRRQTHFDEKLPLTAEPEKVIIPLPEGVQPIEQTETIVTSESSLPTKRLRKRKISLEYDYNEDENDDDKEDDASYHSGEDEDERPRKKQKTPNKRQSVSLPKSPAVGSSPVSSVLAQPRTPLPMQNMQQQQQHSSMQQQQRSFATQMPTQQQAASAMNMYQMPMMNQMAYHQMGYQMPAQYTMPPHMQQTAYAMPQMTQQSYQSMMAQQYSQMHPQAMMHQQMPQMSQMSQMPQQMPQMSQQMPSMSQQYSPMQQMSQQLPPMTSHMGSQQQQQKPVETSTLSPLDYLSNHASKSNYANGAHNGDEKEHHDSVKAQQDHVHDQPKHVHGAVSHHEDHHASVQHAAEHHVADVAQQQVIADAGENKKLPKTPKAKPEKRLGRFRSAPNQNLPRTTTTHVLDRPRSPTNPHGQKFYVLGSVGNVYTVQISHIPSCTCPDHAKGNLCKHILFVFLKVLRVPADSNLIYQNALLTEELESIFKAAPAKPTVLASKNVRDTFDKVMGKTPEKKANNDDDGDVKRKPIEDSMCPICYEDLKANDKLVWCKTSCGQNLHEDCFKQWKDQAKTSRREVTCVYCRAEWPEDAPFKGGAAKSKGAKMNEGYMNLGSLQPGLSSTRDTSSYNSYWAKLKFWQCIFIQEIDAKQQEQDLDQMDNVPAFNSLVDQYKINGELKGSLTFVRPALLLSIWPELARYVHLKNRFKQFQYDKTRFIRLAQFLRKIRGSNIELSDEELHTVLFAMFHFRTPRKLPKKARACKEGLHPICAHMKAIRAHVTKYLNPSPDSEGTFEHVGLAACATDNDEEFDTAVAEITSRFPPSGSSQAVSESPAQLVAKALRQLIANAKIIAVPGSMAPGTDPALLDEGIKIMLELRNGTAWTLLASAILPSLPTEVPSVVESQHEGSCSDDSERIFEDNRATKRQKISANEYQEVFAAPVQSEQQSSDEHSVDAAVANVAQDWSSAPDHGVWNEVMAHTETQAFQVDPDRRISTQL